MPRKKHVDVPGPLPFEKAVNTIYASGKTLEQLAADGSAVTVERLQSAIDEYHQALDQRLEQDKAARKDSFKFFKELGDDLRRIGPTSDFMLLNDLKWIKGSPRQDLHVPKERESGGRSFITQEDVHFPC